MQANGATIWALVMNGVRARVLKVERGTTPTPALDVDLVASRLERRERWSDRPGRGHERVGAMRHAMEHTSDPKEEEAKHLVREACDLLYHETVEHGVDGLILVAPPKIMGMLRSEMHGTLQAKVRAELVKDLAHLSEHELRSHLDSVLESTA